MQPGGFGQNSAKPRYFKGISDINIIIHGSVAKFAENSCFMFAVERTANIKNNPLQVQEIKL
jgi:hypothetical protein